ncbi:MAG: FHA domain-containing protein [Polyangia bacterium]
MVAEKKYRLKFMFQEIDLGEGDFFIGRSPSCNLTLEDPLVSRKHVRIRLRDGVAILDDLGSRNGTLINGEPVFEDYRLQNRDRLRVGSHEMIFIEEKRFHSRPMRATGALVSCSSCGAPFAAGSSRCPHCGMPIVSDAVCAACGRPIGADDETCPHCGAPTRKQREDETIPVELGGASSGWTSVLVSEVIDKALAAERYDQVASLLQGKIDDFERKCARGVVDIGKLVEIGRLNLALAAATRDASRVAWVIEQWKRADAPMPEATLQEVIEAADGWLDLRNPLSGYAEKLTSGTSTDEKRALIERIRRHMDGDGTGSK